MPLFGFRYHLELTQLNRKIIGVCNELRKQDPMASKTPKIMKAFACLHGKFHSTVIDRIIKKI